MDALGPCYLIRSIRSVFSVEKTGRPAQPNGSTMKSFGIHMDKKKELPVAEVYRHRERQDVIIPSGQVHDR